MRERAIALSPGGIRWMNAVPTIDTHVASRSQRDPAIESPDERKFATPADGDRVARFPLLERARALLPLEGNPMNHSKALVLFVASAFLLIGCAADTGSDDPAEDNDGEGEVTDEEVSTSQSEALSKNNGFWSCAAAGRLSQGFRGRAHDGIDIANVIGTDIRAIGAGVVTASGPASGYGQWIRIRHNDGTMSEYGHMSRRLVSVGQRVATHQVIAKMGREGQSTGPHLHLRVYNNANRVGAGNGTDPIAFLASRGLAAIC